MRINKPGGIASPNKHRALIVTFLSAYAMLAGLQHARGDYTALMDADLQDPPALLPSLYRAVTAEGYDCAATCRTSRKGEPPIRSFFVKGFYQIFIIEP